eukprot:NODE_393_length_9450_cov_0.506791.p1 type:complete len:858 gc:universal NODE_393_length_9450_cov_0.506791:4807-7380(+)
MSENIFAKTLDPNPQVRQQAEEAIKQEEIKYTQSPTQWISYVCSLCVSDNSAAVYLKNFVITKWNAMDIVDRQFVKSHIIEWIIHSHGPIRSQHLETLKMLFKCENIDIVSMDQIHSLLQSHLIAGTFILLEICRYFQWKPKSERAPLDLVLTKIFPSALIICQRHLAKFDHDDQIVVKNIMKSFFFTIRFELCNSHLQMLGDWCQLSAELLFKPISDTDVELAGYGAKKWAAHFLTRLFARYGQKSGNRKPEEADFIYNNIAPSIIHAYIQLLTQFVEQNHNFNTCHPLLPNVLLPEKVQHEAIMALQFAIKYKDLWNLLKPHLNSIIPNYFVPLLKLSESDQEVWENDPIEYVHSRLSSWDDAIDVRSSAIIFISEMCEKRKLMIQPVFELIQSLLKGTWYDQEVALTLMSALNYVLRRDIEYKDTIEAFTYDCIIPAMASDIPVLKAKAFYVFSKFCHIDFTGFDHLQKAFQLALLSLQSTLPLSIYGSIAISPLLRFPQLKQLIAPNIPQIMHKLLELTNVIDMDILTDIMEVIVELYSQDIVPYSVELATSLMNSFLRILKNCEADVDLDFTSDKIMTAIGMMKTIQSLILSLENTPAVVYQIEQIACPALEYVLDNDFVDLFEEIFEFIDTVTFTTKSVSPFMWKFFFACFNKLKDTAADYLDHMIPCFDNFIQYGKEQILQDTSTIYNINQLISSLFHSGCIDSDKIPGCLLIETILLHLRGHVDALIPVYVDMALYFLNDLQKQRNSQESTDFRICLIEIVLNCIYYNPVITLALLDSKKCVDDIFGFMIHQHELFRRLHDKKLLILCCCTIMTCPLQSVPPTIQHQLPKLLVFIAHRLQNYQDCINSI